MGMADLEQKPRTGDDSIDELLVELLERITAGESAAVESVCVQHPHLAEEIRSRLAALRDLNLLPSDSAAMAFPERLGDFRLVRRLGGGGMGVVYEAVQESLGRTVALKLIRPEHLFFDRSRERFRRETDAVARLAHPGIVTIHTVGEEQGTPYFAMELIRGATLAQVLEQVSGLAAESLLGPDLRAAVQSLAPDEPEGNAESTPELFAGSWSDACARVILRMTEALAHAHARGVLHRDIKPSNIALTASGRVVLLDFGLAGLEHELRLTATGSALGSVLYMAPEQLTGRSEDIDARTDVYALGVTLYELLALRTPYGGSDSEQARAAILDGRPAPIRARDRNVTRDLELVCLKAMDADPARRYASMEDFGSDLRAASEGRPIRARPPSAAYRVRRWIRRNPATTTAILALVLIVTVLPTGLYLQQRGNSARLQRALDAESAARRLAADEGARADARAREADEVASFLVDLFASTDPYSAGSRDVTAKQMLDDGLARVESELSNQPELQASLYERIGQSYTNLDMYSKALVPLRRALEKRKSLHGEESLETASAKFLLASASRLADEPGSVALLREALGVFERTPDMAPVGLINANTLLAACLLDEGAAGEALERLDRAREMVGGLDAGRLDLEWMVLSMLANAHERIGQHEQAESVAREALALPRPHGSRPDPWHAAGLNTLALALARQGRRQEAREVYEELMPEALAYYGENNVVYAQMQIESLELRSQLGAGEHVVESMLRSFAVLRSGLGCANRTTLSALGILVAAMLREDRGEDCLDLLRDCLSELDAAELRDGPAGSRVLHWIAEICFRRGDVAGATAALRDAVSREDGSDPELGASIRVLLARLLADDPASCAEAAEIARAALDSSSPHVSSLARYVLLRIAISQAESDEADRLLDAVPAFAGQDVPWALAALRVRQAKRLISRGEELEGRAMLKQALADLEHALGPEHPELIEAR